MTRRRDIPMERGARAGARNGARGGARRTGGAAAATRSWALVALRMFLAFWLAFGATLGVQASLADSAFADGDDPAAEEPVEPEPDPPQPAAPRIADVGVFLAGANRDAYAYASDGSVNEVRAVIDQRGGQIDFDGAIVWDDGRPWEFNSSRVQWRLDDSSIATLSPTGILQARGTADGTVRVTAFVDGSETASGAELAASFLVELRGQEGTPYVTDIVICDEAGAPIEDAYRFEKNTLATAMAELTARVSVMDPTTNTTSEFLCTPSSGLAAQTGGVLPNLQWQVADTRLGSVSDEGVYRPLVAGIDVVYAFSDSGFNGSRVEAQATMNMPSADGEDEYAARKPQDALTVKVRYAKYPDQIVAERTFTVDDLEALGTKTYTYTAFSRQDPGYQTYTGRGPLVVDVLKAVGVDPEGVSMFYFDSPYVYKDSISAGQVLDRDRYYFPNVGDGGPSKYGDRQQVPPIIALEGYHNRGTDTSVHRDGMTERDRFYLLLGAQEGGAVSYNLWVYNISGITVELEGEPPYDPGTLVNVRFIDSMTGEVLKSEDATDPDSVGAPGAPHHDGYTFRGWSKSTDGKGNVTYTSVYDSADNPAPGNDDSGGPNPGGGTTGTTDAGDNGPGADAADSQSANASADAPVSSDAVKVTQLSPSDVTAVNAGRLSVIQAINSHPSNVADLMFVNPLAPYVLPTGVGLFCAGGLEVAIRFWNQKRRPAMERRFA